MTTPLDTIIPMIEALMAEVRPIMRSPQADRIEKMRVKFEQALSGFPLDPDIQQDSVAVDGVLAQWSMPPQQAPQRTILYFPGGGYVVCSVQTHQTLIGRLAKASEARALGIDYRRGPEYPFPAALEDAITAYRWLLDHGCNPADLSIVGDSAGGGLAIATLVALRDEGVPLPAATVCLSPWIDLEGLGDSMVSNADSDPFVGKELIQFMAQQYMGNRDWRHPLASPLYADLQGLPPLLIQVSGAETLRDDAIRLANQVRAAGGDLTLDVWEQMVHVWHLFAPILPAGEQAIAQVGAFIKTHTPKH